MLARIINERGLADTALGTLSLTAGAFDDAVSWCVLAIVLATFGGGPGVALIAIVGGLGFALFMFFIARRLLLPLGRIVEDRGELSDAALSIIFMLFAPCAFLLISEERRVGKKCV